MKRGELYRVRRPARDPKPARVFVIVSRQGFVDAGFSEVVCAPVHTRRQGLATEVHVGPREGLKHDSAILCDALQSVPKRQLTDFVGELSLRKTLELDRALAIALGLV
jgi:mRNA interferase MazF